MRNALIVAAVLSIMFFLGCEWNVLAPEDGVLEIEVLNVEIGFYLNENEVYVHNENWDAARVTISRRTEVEGEYIDAFDRYISGRESVIEESYLETGDKIKTYVKVGDVERTNFFEIGSG